MGIPGIIAAIDAAAASAAAKHTSLFLSPVAMTGRMSTLKWIHLRFVCGIVTYEEVTAIWGKIVAINTK